MKALILAAGYGTRLKELGENTPKALLPINGKPLINYILEKLEPLEHLDGVIVVTNNKFHQTFEDWARAESVYPLPIRVVNDGTKSPEDRLGSIGDIQYVVKKLELRDDLLVVGGDNLFNYRLDQFVRFAQERIPAITIGVYDIHDLAEATKFGVVTLDANGKITLFEEKPQAPQSSLIAMCFYYFPQSSLALIADYLKETGKADRAGDYIRWLLNQRDVFGFQFVGKWYDIGSVESYKEANKDFQ